MGKKRKANTQFFSLLPSLLDNDKMLKTKFLEFVKSIAFGIKQVGKKPEDTSKDELNEEEYVSVGSIDETSEAPAPKEGPKPSKIPVVLFYLSVVFTMIGSIICIRLLFMVQVQLEEEPRYTYSWMKNQGTRTVGGGTKVQLQ